MNRISALLLVLAAAILLCPSSPARELREYTLARKVDASDLIFLGEVIALERPKSVMDGVNAYAVIKVTQPIKGARAGDELNFVVRGAITESDPDCCDVGSKYLFFAVKGVQILVLDGTEIGSKFDRQSEFISASNGKFSTYRVTSGIVSNWPGDGAEGDKPLSEVCKEICALK